MSSVRKKYGDPENYERKLQRVMERFGTDEYNYNWDRYGCYVQFRYKGQLYQFEHSVEKAKAHGIDIKYGSDAFAQLVLGLEDLARLAERGIYELQTWLEGMRFLPPPVEVPEFFMFMGFDRIPSNVTEVEDRYRVLIKKYHPDAGGNAELFIF